MKNKLTNLELRKIISERILLYEADKKSYEFDDKIKTLEDEIQFRRWVNQNKKYITAINGFYNNTGGKYKGQTLDATTTEKNMKNNYVKAAWLVKVDNKTIGQAYIEESIDKRTSEQDLADGANDISTMKDFQWDDIVPRVKALCDTGKQPAAEVLLLLYAKWNCSSVEGEGESAIIKTNPDKWGKVKDKLGQYLKVGITAEEYFKKNKEEPAGGKDQQTAVDTIKKGASLKTDSDGITAINNAENKKND